MRRTAMRGTGGGRSDKWRGGTGPETEALPPRGAMWILNRAVPADASKMVVEDLTEIFQARVRAGTMATRLWFWWQTALFSARFTLERLWERLRGGAPGGGRRGSRGSQHGPGDSGRNQGTGQQRFRGGNLGSSGFGARSRQTFRRLAKDWRYSLGIILILGIGIGPAAAMLSVVNRVLLRPLGYSEPDRLGLVRIDIGELHNHPGLAISEIADLRNTDGLFQAVEGMDRGSEISLGEGDEMVPVFMKRVTPGTFETLGVSPQIGRYFTEEDPDAHVVMLSHRLWQSHFGSDPDLVGLTVVLNGRSYEVAGVMPADFALRIRRGSRVHTPVDVWFPFRLVEHRSFWAFPTLVRLRDGVSFEQANGALEAFARGLSEQHPEAYVGAPLRFVVHPLLPDLVQETRPAINAALAGVLLLLLTSVVNATALLVVGLKGREQELAVRSAMGAGRRTLVSDVVMESVILSAAGAAVGAGLATFGVAALKSVMPRSVPRWETITLGWETLALSAILALVALLIAGVIPAWKVAQAAPWQGLRAASGRGRTRRTPGQSILVGSQIAMAVVLLFGALQLGRSARELAATDLRFDPENVLGFKVPLDYSALPERTSDVDVYLQLRDRLAGLPGVRFVGAISNLPLSGTGPSDAFTPDLADTLAAWDNALANYLPVLPGYFESVRIPLRQGRYFTDDECREGEQVIIVDETLARMAYPGEDPIGRTLRLGWGIPDSRIVGVVAHARIKDPSQEVRPQIYTPYGLFRWNPLHFTVRAEGDPRVLIPAVRAAAADIGTGRALSGFQLLSDNVATATSTLRAVAILLVALALSAALLAALGLYAVVSSVVIQQRKATAIRGALGASPGLLLRQQLRAGSMVLIPALPLGVIVSLLGAQLLETLVYGVGVRDPGSLAVAGVLGALVGILGTYLPARRAAKTDPASALQLE